jgi:hypothetical protein
VNIGAFGCVPASAAGIGPAPGPIPGFTIGGAIEPLLARGPGSVGAIAWICSPHCWQYANADGVAVPQRGHEIMPPPAARAMEAAGPTAASGDGSGADATGPGGISPGAVDGNGPPGGMPGIAAPGGPPSAPGIGSAPSDGGGMGGCAMSAPQLRQNFMPIGFSPWQLVQIVVAGNALGGGAVCA